MNRRSMRLDVKCVAAVASAWIVLSISATFVSARHVALDRQQLLRDLDVLAGDDMQGRLAGTPGNLRAREYIVRRLRENGVQPAGASFEESFTYRARDGAERRGTNVAGTIAGADESHYIVVTAHYDHLGVRDGQIYNGADDNASGVAALLAVAAWFGREKPRHSLLLAALDAEESGLNGAYALVRSPPVARESLALNVNLDMLGRDASNRLFAVGTHQNPFLKPYLEHVAQPPITLVFGHDVPGGKAEDWTRDSDHYAFYEAGIPFVYFGVEDYEQHHKTTDDASTIMKEFFVGSTATAIAAVESLDAHLDEIVRRATRPR